MKNVLLYFPFNGNISDLDTPYKGLYPNIAKRQEPLLKVLEQYNCNIYLTRHHSAYVKDEFFIPHFKRINGIWVKYNSGEIYSDLTIGMKIPKNVKNIFPSLEEYMRDKTVTEKLFPEYIVSSTICNTYDEILASFNLISTKLKVLKPHNGSQGNGIIISQTLPKQKQLDTDGYPYLLQEFIDTSSGFYDYPGYHDFRVIILSGKVIGKILRQPKQGSLIANVGQQGALLDLQNFTIPKEIEKIIFKIDSYFKKKSFHRYYSIDFGIQKDGNIKIFEMNSYPGLGVSGVAIRLGHYMAKNILKLG